MNDTKFELPIQMLDEPEPDGGMEMLGYLFAALILTLAAIGIGFVIGRYLW